MLFAYMKNEEEETTCFVLHKGGFKERYIKVNHFSSERSSSGHKFVFNRIPTNISDNFYQWNK